MYLIKKHTRRCKLQTLEMEEKVEIYVPHIYDEKHKKLDSR